MGSRTSHLDGQSVPGGGKGWDGEDCQGSRRLLSAERGEVEGHLLEQEVQEVEGDLLSHCWVHGSDAWWVEVKYKDLGPLLVEASIRECWWIAVGRRDLIRAGVIR